MKTGTHSSLNRAVQLICLLTLSVLAASPGRAAKPVMQDPYEHFFSSSFGDLSDDLATARDEGKKAIFVFFEMDECPFCHRMKTTVLNRPEVQAYYREHFLNLSIDIEGDTELVDFEGNTTTAKDWSEKKHRVRATPVMAFFDLEGNRIARYIGATSGTDEFLLFGEFVASGAYKTERFTKYKRERRAASKN